MMRTMMPNSLRRRLPALVMIGVTSAALAGGFDLSWYTIDAGGGTSSTGGSFSLSGTVGQPDAGTTMSGGSYELVGGFWTASGSTGTCTGDVNDDGLVDGADLGLLLSQWGEEGSADFNHDGTVDGADLGVLLGAWGPCPS